MNCTVTRRTVLNDRELRAVQVSFCKEEGKDDGGLTRHWFMLISREFVNPQYAMFIAVGKNGNFQINAASKVQPHFLDYFCFIGRIWSRPARNPKTVPGITCSHSNIYWSKMPRLNALLTAVARHFGTVFS
jgi:hypothetical protein